MRSLSDQLRDLGLAKPSGSDRDELHDLKLFLRRAQSNCAIRISPRELNAMVDCAAGMNWRASRNDENAVISESVKGWIRAAERETESSVYLGRLFVFSRHASAASAFLAQLAVRLARHDDGQFSEDRWTRLAQRLAGRSPEFQERVRQASEPFVAAKRERIRALAELQRRHHQALVRNEMDRRIQRAAALEALADHIQKFLPIDVPVVYSTAEPQETDISLCGVWAGRPAAESAKIRSLKELKALIGPNEANRLMSARLAERVAADFYRTLGHQVHDTSIEQLSGSSTRWKTHDLEADESPLDVKNARTAYSSPSSYSEWCISRYKMDRGNDIRLVGVLSQYVPLGRMDEMMGRAEATVLGETTREQMARIAKWTNSMTDGRLEIVDPRGSRFLAGWCFDYPDRFYRNLPEVINGLPDRILELERAGVDVTELPLIVRFLAGVTRDDTSAHVVRLKSLQDNVGFSRMGGVALALVELVRATHGDETAQPLGLWESVFPVGRHGPLLNFPLLRYDPERHVATMVDAIRQVWTLCRSHISKFQRFRMSGAGIFQGADSSGLWTTILAYCGGWRLQPPIARCGTTPLIMGVDQTCPMCRRLICRNCGYCGSSCPECEMRQKSLAEEKADGGEYVVES